MPEEPLETLIEKGALTEEQVYEKLEEQDVLLHFNGVNGETGDYAIPPMTGAQLAALIAGEEKPGNLGELKFKQDRWTKGPFPAPMGVRDVNDLGQMGWAVIFPEEMDDDEREAIKEALQPLLKLRRSQAGDEHFKVFEGFDELTGGYSHGETKQDFLDRREISIGLPDPDELPYYVMIVGSPEQIPFEFQYQLDVMRGVGRVYFDAETLQANGHGLTPLEAYARYAQSVVQAETGKLRLSPTAALFGVSDEGDPATELSSQYLMRPVQAAMQEDVPAWTQEAFFDRAATKAQLDTLLTDSQGPPALLFSASHGVEFPLNHRHQLAHQGAILCQGWKARKAGERLRDFYFAGEDLSSATNLMGMMAFFFACYGAGTPSLDQFAHLKKTQPQIAPHSFIGALPVGLLSHGSLAVVGHVERAWGYSFLSPKSKKQTRNFEGALTQLMQRDRVGWITEHFNMSYAALATQLSQNLDRLKRKPDFINPYDLAQHWSRNNDARGYVVMGDPAARIPFANPDESPTERPDLGTLAVPATPPHTGRDPNRPAEPFSAQSGPDTDFGRGIFGGRDGKEEAEGDIEEERRSVLDSLMDVAGTLAQQLGNAVANVSSLSVKTYSSHNIDGVRYHAQSGELNGELKLRAMTYISFDGDMRICIPEKADGSLDRELWEIHQEMVKEAQANRTKFFETVTQLAARLAGK